MLRTPAATLPPPKTKPWKQTHEPVRRHHRLIDRREERTRDLYDPRDLVTPHSISGAGVFLFLSRPRESRLRRADHERRTEILADRFLATHLPLGRGISRFPDVELHI
jgi:hypothetical protein